jgi:geranylgeranyl diphosphate synthase type II
MVAVEQHIDDFFTNRIKAAAAHGIEYSELWTEARMAIAGGKRLRPALVIGAYRKLEGAAAGLPAAITVAAAFEVLHTAFLLHDDVIDQDVVRRGRPNLQGVFATRARQSGIQADRATAWGQASAVLAGDLLLHAAQRMIAGLDLDAAIRTGLLDLLDESVFVTAGGELFDVAFGLGVAPSRMADVLAMTERKTADYSFGSPLAAGALLAGAPPDAGRTLREFGRLIGTAFQLRDDVLGVFGEEASTGKSVLTDLRRGTMTPLIAFARDTPNWPQISPYLGRDLSAEEAARARAVLAESGARTFVETLIADFSARAVRVADSPSLPRRLSRHLVQVAASATERAA